MYNDQGKLRIRDLHIFKEDYPDPFEDKVCPNNEATYDALPLVDGNIYSGNQVIAGAYLVDANGTPFAANDFRFTQTGENSALVDYGAIRFTLMENGMKITADKDFVLDTRIGKTDHHFPTMVSCNSATLRLHYNGMDYGIELAAGRFDGATKICSENGIIELQFT